jgi:hypothetical protein
MISPTGSNKGIPPGPWCYARGVTGAAGSTHEDLRHFCDVGFHIGRFLARSRFPSVLSASWNHPFNVVHDDEPATLPFVCHGVAAGN